MYDNLTEIMNIKDEKERKARLKRYEVYAKAKDISKSRFIHDVKYIYNNCEQSSVNNGDFDKLCETLGFSEHDTINRDIKSVVLSEIIQHKNNLGGIIYDTIDHIRELMEQNENIDYGILLIRMFLIVGTKQDILNLYTCMIARLKLDQIKAIQNQINQ